MRVVLLLVFLGPAWIGSAQQYPFVLVPGTPPNSAVSFQDHLGRLWWSSPTGPQYFDGSRLFSLQQAGFASTGARSFGSVFAEDDGGGIWFVSLEGVYRFSNGRIDRMLSGVAESVVRVGPDLMLASIGPVSGLSLYRFRKQGIAWKVDQLSDWQARSQGRVTVDHHGNVVFACPGAWCELSSDTIKNWHPGSNDAPIRHPDVYPGIEIILRDSVGCVWFRSPGGAKYQCPRDGQPIQLPLEVASNGVGMEESFDGSIVVTSYLSVAIGRPGHFLVITSQNGMPSLGSGFLAKDGTLWMAAQKGLYRSSYLSRLEFWTDREGLQAPFSILRTGGKTFASSGLGIAALNEDRSRWLPLKATRELGVVRNIQRGPGKTLMAVSHHNGVAQVSLDGRILARSAPGADPEAMQLAQTPDGQYWLAGSGVGRVQFRGTQLKVIPEPLPPPLTFGTDIEYEPHTQKLWACYAGGLIVKEGTSWRRITKNDGLLENACRSLAALPNGDVWFGYFATKAFALVHMPPSGKVSLRQYLPNNEFDTPRMPYFLDTDSRGWLWRGSAVGTLVADLSQAEAGTWISLNEDDGLPAAGANQQSFRNDPDGSVWWAADNSIIHFSPPADFVHPTFAPSIFVSGYSLGGAAPKLADLVHQIPHGSDVTAHVGSLQFDRRNNLRVRYRLLPDQQQWREGRELNLKLGKVPWGLHTLEVQARLFTGPWSGVQRHSFSVLPPFWLTWRFLLACLLTSSAIVALLYRARNKRRRLRKRSLPDLDDLRLLALSPEAHDVVGTVLDSRYEAGRVLARGGFATVLKGRDRQRGGRACAIKVFREELKEKAWTIRSFQQEVAALEQIRHPNVVAIYGHGVTTGGLPYLVMEFIEGRTLRDLIDDGPISPATTAALLRQIGRALAEIHSHGILHRDVTPDNLMIRSNGAELELVLIDFSIAIVKTRDEALHGKSRAAGTFAYMAPEQVMGGGLPASDIYSLARIVIEMLTGQRVADLPPGPATNLSLRVRESLSTMVLAISQRSIDLLASALEYNPPLRPQSIQDFVPPIASDLEAL